jgi:hypothetical protein
MGIVSCGLACGTAEPAPKLPPVDEQGLAAATAAIAQAPPESRPIFAARAFAEVERGRFPASFLEGFIGYAEAEPAMRGMILAKAIDTNIELFEKACPGQSRPLLREIGGLAPEEGFPKLEANCNFARFGLVDDATAAATDSWFVVIVYMAYARLEAAGKVDEREKALLREILVAREPVDEEPVPP